MTLVAASRLLTPVLMFGLLPMQALATTHGLVEVKLVAPSVSPKPMRVRVWLPPGYRAHPATRYPTLYVNDGQDMEAVGLQSTLDDLYRHHLIKPMIVVAIDMPQDRMAGYGVSNRARGVSVVVSTKYGPVGANAQVYSQWLAETLVPYVDAHWQTRRNADQRWLLGWSLGAINAFSVGWQYPQTFGRVGAFSPSFWLSTDSSNARAVQATRIAHVLVESVPPPLGSRFFFAAGDAEEKNDRDGDGVIDVIDDVLDLMRGWKGDNGSEHKGLMQLGYSIDADYATKPDGSAAVFYRLPGGEHNQKSWARMLPAFLEWVDGTHGDVAVQQVGGSASPMAGWGHKNRRRTALKTR
ncbi:MAG: esterase family protein [Proteobacteria bacterium]|nr:esterase family protein [Pseudomonadota bacterium]